MARIIESQTSNRRIIQMSANDIISIVQDYQKLTYNLSKYDDIVKALNKNCIFIPEDIS